MKSRVIQDEPSPVEPEAPPAPASERPPALWRRVVVRPTPMPTNLPKWLVGDWNRVIRDPLDLLRLAPLIGAIVTVIVGDTTHTVELLGAFLIVLAPRVLNVQRPFDLVFQLGMNLAIWGNVFGLFDQIYGYDKVVHFILPCGSAMLLYIALCHLQAGARPLRGRRPARPGRDGARHARLRPHRRRHLRDLGVVLEHRCSARRCSSPTATRSAT